jgi:hypothetical protein
MAPSARNDLLRGTLDLPVLKVLHLGAMHGWGVTERLEPRRRARQMGAAIRAVNLVLGMSVV